MDTVVEQIVKKAKTGRDTLIKILIIVGLLLIPFVFYGISIITNTPYFVIAGIFAFAFGVYGAWYFITSLKQEYEYCITNNNLTVDKIIAMRKRKIVLSIDVKTIEVFCKLKEFDYKSNKFNKEFFAGDEKDEDNLYACVLTTKKWGKCLLVFSPNEKIIKAMKPYLNKDIVLKLLYGKK